MVIYLLVLIFLGPLMLLRLIVTVYMRNKVYKAIYKYNCNLIRHHNDVYDEKRIEYKKVVEPFVLTYLNFFNLGCDELLPNKEYRKIKKYLK